MHSQRRIQEFRRGSFRENMANASYMEAWGLFSQQVQGHRAYCVGGKGWRQTACILSRGDFQFRGEYIVHFIWQKFSCDFPADYKSDAGLMMIMGVHADRHGQGANSTLKSRNRKHRRAAAKPAACPKSLMWSTVGSRRKEKREGG